MGKIVNELFMGVDGHFDKSKYRVWYNKQHPNQSKIQRMRSSKETKYKYIQNRRERRRDLKREMIMLFGGKCKYCGYNKSIAALDFHHINPLEKKTEISNLLHKGKREAIMEEIVKCELICSNCHREKTYMNTNLDEGLVNPRRE